MFIELTDQQRQVIAHDEGPALVYAVAGAGKTTAMVHRIERLVRERVFAADKVLATSFGKNNERDLREALQRWPHCGNVRVSTLHALGFDIVRRGRQNGMLPVPTREVEIARLDAQLLNLTIAEAHQRNLPFRRELYGLDRQDFLDYVGRCKSNLAYADLAAAALPSGAQRLAVQAEAPSQTLDWYLPLYQLYETVRGRLAWITFDDMLLSSWELLQRHDDLLMHAQGRFDCVLVDEFQDINLVQSEILDLLTADRRNYMAIGDDDQTIYEWRGAHPRYILEFPDRYQACSYVISDNFRCPATPLVLANQVIRRNKQRQRKQLNLTKGFDGATQLHVDGSVDEMAQSIVDRIDRLHSQGRALHDIAVLVRLNAQTPPIEQKLIANKIAYQVSKPFYERLEIKVLIAYCRLAWFEQRLREGKALGRRQQATWEEDWRLIHNRPKRYINNELKQSIPQEVLRRGRPLADVLYGHANRISRDYLIDKLEALADTIEWLADNLTASAERTLRFLDLRLGYQTYLRDSTGSRQIGEGRAVSVASFIKYAEGKGDLLQFMAHIRQLADQKIGREQGVRDRVTLSTIHQAKGLEWSIVILPNCNQGVLPFIETFAAQIDLDAHVEEERRLFYVALTRTKEQLHLHLLKSDQQSQFITEARVQATAIVVAKIHEALQRDVEAWRLRDARAARDARMIVVNTRRFGFERYFRYYWTDDERRAIIGCFAHEVKRRDAAARLGISPLDLDVWLQLEAGGGDGPFPGIDALLENGRLLPAEMRAAERTSLRP